MSYWQRLWRVEILALIALIGYSVISGIITVIDAGPDWGGWAAGVTWLWVGFAFPLVFGALPVVLYGAPVFTAYLQFPTVSRWMMYAAAVAPGLLYQLSSDDFGRQLAFAGLVVAFLMDQLSLRWPELRDKAA